MDNRIEEQDSRYTRGKNNIHYNY